MKSWRWIHVLGWRFWNRAGTFTFYLWELTFSYFFTILWCLFQRKLTFLEQFWNTFLNISLIKSNVSGDLRSCYWFWNSFRLHFTTSFWDHFWNSLWNISAAKSNISSDFSCISVETNIIFTTGRWILEHSKRPVDSGTLWVTRTDSGTLNQH